MPKVSEKSFQTRLIKDLKASGHRVKKMQSGMGYVVLDLYVRHRVLGAQWWELKTMPSVKCKIPLSEIQRNEIRGECLAGGAAGCVTLVKKGNVEWVFVTDAEEEYVSRTIQERRVGERFDISRIANEINTKSEGFRLRTSRGKS